MKYGQCKVALCSALVWLAHAPTASAQIGSGWTRYTPGSNIQLDGSNGIESYPGSTTSKRNEGASFERAGGIETFTIFDNVSNRSERRMLDEYRSGRRQFEGEVRVSPPTDDQSVMQVFGGTSGATTQMIRAYASNGGTLKKVPGGVTLATGIHGRWIRINVIHDVGANRVHTYVDGQLKATGDGEAPSTWYHKYGAYGTLKRDSAKVEWRNVKHFRAGGAAASAYAASEGEGAGGLAPVAAPAAEGVAPEVPDDVIVPVDEPADDWSATAASAPVAGGCTMASAGTAPLGVLGLLAFGLVARAMRGRWREKIPRSE